MSLSISFDSLQCKKDKSIKCEDVFFKRISENGEYGIFCLCDGASESYNSSEWASILCHNYVDDKYSNIKHFDHIASQNFIDICIEKYESKININTLSWSQQASFLRGSFSTLLGIWFFKNKIKIFAVGDSVALCFKRDKIKSKWKIQKKFQYVSPDEFREKPTLISTNRNLNLFLNEKSCKKRSTRWSIHKDDTILMMSDAVAEWIWRNYNKNNCLDMVFEFFNNDNLQDRDLKFEEFIYHERECKRLRTDDSTIIKLEFQEQK